MRLPLASLQRPAEIVSLGERKSGVAEIGTSPSGDPPLWTKEMFPRVDWARHSLGSHYAFCDGHAKWIRDTESQKIEHWVNK